MLFWAKLLCPTHILITGKVKFYQKNSMYRQHFHNIGTVIYYTVLYPKCAYGPYCYLNPIKNGVYTYILVEVSFYISTTW